MTSRALRKLQKNSTIPSFINDTDKEEEEEEEQVSIKTNLYSQFLQEDTMNELPSSEEEDQDTPISYNTIKTNKKKKKKKKKQVSLDNSKEEEDDDLDALLQQMKFDNNIGESSSIESSSKKSTKSLLSVDVRFLDVDGELRRMFGSVAVSQIQSSKRSSRHKSKCIMANPTDTWPRMSKLGLNMEYKDGSFSFTHSKFYSEIQIQFLQASHTHDPNNISHILQMFPYHIDSLLQMSEILKSNGDPALASELIQRALYTFEKSIHPMFSLFSGSCRLNFDRVENRSFYLCLFRHIDFISRKGCWRSAFEFQKMLLSLDFENDPYACLLMIDFYALKSNQYQWFVDFYDSYKKENKLDFFPNLLYSRALAEWELETLQQRNHEMSNQLLRDAILAFPSAVPLIYESAAQSEPRLLHSYFTSQPKDSFIHVLITIFIEKHVSLWKMADIFSWFKSQVVSILDEQSNIASHSKVQRALLVETPLNILRFIFVSDIKSLMGTLNGVVRREIMGHDPLVPPTALHSTYDEYMASSNAQNPLSSTSFIGGLLTSLLPWITPEGLPDASANRNTAGREEFLRVLRDAEERVERGDVNGNNVQEARDWIHTLSQVLGLNHGPQEPADEEESDSNNSLE